MANHDKCFCGVIDILIGVRIVAGFSIGLTVLQLIASFTSDVGASVFLIQVILTIAGCGAWALVFLAVERKNYLFVLPALIEQFVVMLLLVGSTVVSVLIVFAPYSQPGLALQEYLQKDPRLTDLVRQGKATWESLASSTARLLTVWSIVLEAFAAWFFTVVLDAHATLKNAASGYARQEEDMDTA